jgi:hypothetical protein
MSRNARAELEEQRKMRLFAPKHPRRPSIDAEPGLAVLARNKANRIPPPKQFPSNWPDAPEDAAGIARTLSRGL